MYWILRLLREYWQSIEKCGKAPSILLLWQVFQHIWSCGTLALYKYICYYYINRYSPVATTAATSTLRQQNKYKQGNKTHSFRKYSCWLKSYESLTQRIGKFRFKKLSPRAVCIMVYMLHDSSEYDVFLDWWERETEWQTECSPLWEGSIIINDWQRASAERCARVPLGMRMPRQRWRLKHQRENAGYWHRWTSR